MLLEFFALSAFLLAQETATDPPPEESEAWIHGHSLHGEAFNDGPRQAAYLMGQCGAIDFQITTSQDQAQAFFNQGMGQLHGFWYLESERSFRQVAWLDPDCAMAYWGMALSVIEKDMARAEGFTREAFSRREPITDVERRHIEALAKFFEVKEEPKEDKKKADDKKPQEPKKLTADQDKKRRQAYIQDLEAIIYDYPDHIETKALLVNQLWLNTRKGIKTSSRQANQALLDQVFEAAPMHPAHHYRIHLWDSKETAYRVASSAAVIGHTAPGIAHMWHMGGHIWARLGRHDDAAWMQEASARVDHAHMMRDRVLPDQIHNYAHNNEWLIRSLTHVGRVSEALDLSQNMIELPRHPKFNAPDKRGSASYGRQRLFQVLETFELWEQVLEFDEKGYFQLGYSTETSGKDEAARALIVGKAHHANQNKDGLVDEIETLRECESQEKVRRTEAIELAEAKALEEEKKPGEIEKAMTEAMKKSTGPIREIQRHIKSLEALALLLDGETDTALENLEKAKFDKLTLARLYSEAGNHDKAMKLARESTKNKEGMAAAWANLAYIAHKAGKSDQAREAMTTLRDFSGGFDLNAEMFRRLRPLARELEWPQDWRVTQTKDDVGKRVDLESLGPFRWSPVAAPTFALTESGAKPVRLEDYRGRPVLLVFFLGFGCVHCVEQLGVMMEMAKEFEEAGITILAIGTDAKEPSPEDGSPKSEFAFPILVDSQLEVFKAYRCYDDFEEMALHGTFLIDADGMIRWQDISYEPYMEIEFLFHESKRLLRFEHASSE